MRVLAVPRLVAVRRVVVEVVVEVEVLVLVRGRALAVVQQRRGLGLLAAAGGVQALQRRVHVIHQGLQVHVILCGEDENSENQHHAALRSRKLVKHTLNSI